MARSRRLSIARALVKDPDILAQAIESVLGQTHRDLEFVVIDDGSTDGSLGIMERYARADRRVRVFTQENQGVTATANRGLEEARGDWVARLDADDLFFPEKIERQLAFVKRHPDLRIAGTRGWFINDRGRSLGLVGTEGPFTREEFLCRRQSGEPVYFIHSSTLMHREAMLAIGGYRTQFVQAEGVDLWLRAAERGYLLLKIPEPLVLYRIHCESVPTLAKNAEQKLCHRWESMAGAQARQRSAPSLPLRCFALPSGTGPRARRPGPSCSRPANASTRRRPADMPPESEPLMERHALAFVTEQSDRPLSGVALGELSRAVLERGVSFRFGAWAGACTP